MAEIEVETTAPVTPICEDGGWKSRKLWLTLFAMGMMSGLGLLGSLKALDGLGANLPTLVGGILGALGIYSGANVGVRAVHHRAAKVPTVPAAPKGKAK